MDTIRTLLSECTLEAVAHKRENFIKTVNDSSLVSEALQVLSSAKVLSVAVLDTSGSFRGVVSVNDCLRQLIQELKLEKTNHECTEEEVTAAMVAMGSRKVGDIMHSGDLWYIEGKNPTVLDAVKEMLSEKVTHHRVYTCNSLKDTRPAGILSQYDVVQMMWDHRVELGPLLKKSVSELGLCAAAAETVVATEPTVQVLLAMYRDRKTCMGVVDAIGGDLIGNLSASDLRNVTPELYPKLVAPVGEFILALRGMPVPTGQVDWKDALKNIPVHSVSTSATFEDVLKMLSLYNLHRVYVVDAVKTGTFVGIITLTDVLRPLNPPESIELPCAGDAGGLPSGNGEEVDGEIPTAMPAQVTA